MNNTIRFLGTTDVTSLPSNALPGEIAFCTSTSEMYVHDGTGWQNVILSNNIYDWSLYEPPMSLFRSSYLLKRYKYDRNQKSKR